MADLFYLKDKKNRIDFYEINPVYYQFLINYFYPKASFTNSAKSS